MHILFFHGSLYAVFCVLYGEGIAMTFISLCETAQLRFYSASKAGFWGTAHAVFSSVLPSSGSFLPNLPLPKVLNWKPLNTVLKDDTLLNDCACFIVVLLVLEEDLRPSVTSSLTAVAENKIHCYPSCLLVPFFSWSAVFFSVLTVKCNFAVKTTGICGNYWEFI